MSEARDDRFFEKAFQHDLSMEAIAQKKQGLFEKVGIDGLIHKDGKEYDPNDMHEVIPEEQNDLLIRDHPISGARDDTWYESAYLEQVADEH